MTADTKPESKKPDRPGPLLAWWVAKQVESLGEGYMKNDAGAVGRAARLRSVAARGALVNADAWEALGGFPTTLRGHDDELSRAERAAFAALATFAVHQQAQRTQLVHVPKQGLGSALRRLGADHPSDAPIVRRFRALVAAQSYDAAVRHLTGLERGDRHRDPVGVKAHRHVELEPRGDRRVRHRRDVQRHRPGLVVDREVDGLELLDPADPHAHGALAGRADADVRGQAVADHGLAGATIEHIAAAAEVPARG